MWNLLKNIVCFLRGHRIDTELYRDKEGVLMRRGFCGRCGEQGGTVEVWEPPKAKESATKYHKAAQSPPGLEDWVDPTFMYDCMTSVTRAPRTRSCCHGRCKCEGS